MASIIQIIIDLVKKYYYLICFYRLYKRFVRFQFNMQFIIGLRKIMKTLDLKMEDFTVLEPEVQDLRKTRSDNHKNTINEMAHLISVATGVKNSLIETKLQNQELYVSVSNKSILKTANQKKLRTDEILSTIVQKALSEKFYCFSYDMIDPQLLLEIWIARSSLSAFYLTAKLTPGNLNDQSIFRSINKINYNRLTHIFLFKVLYFGESYVEELLQGFDQKGKKRLLCALKNYRKLLSSAVYSETKGLGFCPNCFLQVKYPLVKNKMIRIFCPSCNHSWVWDNDNPSMCKIWGEWLESHLVK